MFIHLGREKICLRSAQGSYKELPYLDIERKLPPLLHACIEERTPDMLWVLQGPGSFTTLRLGCLTLSTLMHMGMLDIPVYTCAKPILYGAAINAGMLSSQCYMFIGQKKNMWRSRYENSTWTYSVVNEPIHTQADYFVDPCAHMLVENMEQDVMLSLSYTAEGLQLERKGRTWSCTPDTLGLEPVQSLSPLYLIDPQIG